MATGEWKKTLNTKQVQLVEEAAEAFELQPHEIFAAAVRGEVATIVTIGGHKCTYRSGGEVKPLHPLHAGRSIKPAEAPAPPAA
jgi:hypothetical protein